MLYKYSSLLFPALCLVILFCFPVYAQSQPIDEFDEEFIDIDELPGLGWVMQNNSDPGGITGWFQGNPAVFPSIDGDNDFIGANFNNANGENGTISNWLITPEVRLVNSTELSFWTRTIRGSTFPDRLEVRLSTEGSSTDVGETATSVGDFTILLLSINEDLDLRGYPEDPDWVNFVITVEGLDAPTSGRFAFRFYVTDAGPQGANSNYIGIDKVSVSQFIR